MTRLVILVLVVARISMAAPASIMLPSIAGAFTSGAVGGTDVLQCATYVAPQTMTATKLGLKRATGAGTMGVALYPDSDAGTQLGEAIGATGADATATGLTIPIVAGTRYRVCACGSATTVNYTSLYQSGTGVGRLPDLLNAATLTTTVGTAANPCVTGNPPTTTGALTASTAFKIPLVILE